MSLLGELRELTRTATYDPKNDENAVQAFEKIGDLCRRAALLRDKDTKITWDSVGLGLTGADNWAEDRIRRTRRGVVTLLERENLSVQEVNGMYMFIAW